MNLLGHFFYSLNDAIHRIGPKAGLMVMAMLSELSITAILLEYMGNRKLSLFESFIEKMLAIW